MAAARQTTPRRPALSSPVALSAAAALVLAPLALPVAPAAAADSVSFLDENPGDGVHVFFGGVNLLVAQLSVDDALSVAVDGVSVDEDDLEAWIDLTPEIGDDATDEEWNQAVDDFMEGTPMDVAVELWVFADVPDGAELTVTVGDVSATNTMIAAPEWSRTGPSRVYTDDLAATGLPASGIVSPASLPHVDGDVFASVFLYEQDDFQEVTRIWFQLDDDRVDLAADGSFSSAVAPTDEFVGIDFDWSDPDEYSVGTGEAPSGVDLTLGGSSGASADGAAAGSAIAGSAASAASSGIDASFVRDGSTAQDPARGGGSGAPERTADAEVDEQLDVIARWYREAIEDGTLSDELDDSDDSDDFEDEEIATLAEISQRDGLDHGFHVVYGDFAGGQWEFDEEDGGAFSIRHGSAPGIDPAPTEPSQTPSTAPGGDDEDSGGRSDDDSGADDDRNRAGDGRHDADRRAGADRLPRTGAEFAGPAALGGLLVAAGAAALVVSRKRRS